MFEPKTKEEFQEALQEDGPVLLYFGTESCSVCHSVYPKLLNLAEGHSCRLIKVAADQLRDVAGQYLIFTVPTILLLHEGKEILRESRFVDFNNIERLLSLLED